MKISAFLSIAAVISLALTSVPSMAQSSMEPSGENPDVDIYGLTLGMSPDQLLEVLRAKHPSIREYENYEYQRSLERKERINGYNEKATPCPGSSAICSKTIRATVTEGLAPSDSYSIFVQFRRDLPVDPEYYFASAITFEHSYGVIDFSPSDFFEEKYGHVGTVKIRTRPINKGEVLGSTYRDQPVKLRYEWRETPTKRAYEISMGAPLSKEHWNAVLEAITQPVPKSEKPF